MTQSPPVVVLVAPQLGENIGMVARAMLNFGLRDLRLVSPRNGWPNPAAGPASAGADKVLDQAQVFDDPHRYSAASACATDPDLLEVFVSLPVVLARHLPSICSSSDIP